MFDSQFYSNSKIMKYAFPTLGQSQFMLVAQEIHYTQIENC